MTAAAAEPQAPARPNPLFLTADEDLIFTNHILAVGLAGWSNLRDREGNACTFALKTAIFRGETLRVVDGCDDALTYAEKWELIHAMKSQTAASEMDKKKFASQSAGVLERSARRASAAAAPTAPANPSRSNSTASPAAADPHTPAVTDATVAAAPAST